MTELSTLLAYLENPEFLTTTSTCVLEYASRNDLPKIAKEVYVRLFLNEAPRYESV